MPNNNPHNPGCIGPEFCDLAGAEKHQLDHICFDDCCRPCALWLEDRAQTIEIEEMIAEEEEEEEVPVQFSDLISIPPEPPPPGFPDWDTYYANT